MLKYLEPVKLTLVGYYFRFNFGEMIYVLNHHVYNLTLPQFKFSRTGRQCGRFSYTLLRFDEYAAAQMCVTIPETTVVKRPRARRKTAPAASPPLYRMSRPLAMGNLLLTIAREYLHGGGGDG